MPSLNVSDGIVLANYMLEQAVAHAAGCGGDIRIVWMAEDGTAAQVPVEHYTTDLFKAMDRTFSDLFSEIANFQSKENWIEMKWGQAKEYLTRLRKEQLERIEKADKDREKFQKSLERFDKMAAEQKALDAKRPT